MKIAHCEEKYNNKLHFFGKKCVIFPYGFAKDKAND